MKTYFLLLLVLFLVIFVSFPTRINAQHVEASSLLSVYCDSSFLDKKMIFDVDSVKIREQTRLAKKGNAEALFYMGLYHYMGWGVPLDIAKATDYFVRSAKRGNGMAQNELGNFYEKGEVVGKSDSLAVFYYSQAAAKGMPLGCYNLARYYKTGAGGLPKDVVRAMSYFRYAAKRGIVEAWLELGNYYELGLDTIADFSQAVACYRAGAELGNKECQFYLGACYALGKGVPFDVAQSIYWCGFSADQGYEPAQYYIGYILSVDNGFMKDLDKSVYYLTPLAEKGNIEAQNSLIRSLHMQNKNTEAMKWIMRVAEQGDSKAQNYLGFSYMKGTNGLEKNVEKGLYWIECSVEKTDSVTLYNIGRELLKFDSLSAQRKGIDLLFRAAKRGYMKANIYLGQYFAAGFGCPPKNFDEHIIQMLPLARGGSVNAQYSLAGGYCAKLDVEQARYWLSQVNSRSKEKAEKLLKLLPK